MNSNENETQRVVTISKEEYKDLLHDSRLLQCLRNAGVDNWEWWDTAIEEYQELYGEDD